MLYSQAIVIRNPNDIGVIALLSLAILPLFLLAAPPDIPEYEQRSFTTADGLPANQVTALLQTSDGFLWVGSRFGLTRFDGQEVVNFNQANTAEFAATSETIIDLCEDNGAVWVATARGIVRLSKGRRMVITDKTGLPHPQVLALAPSRNGGVWVGTHEGGARVTETNVVPITAQTIANSPVDALIEARDGAVWFAARGRLVRWRPDTQEETILYQARGGRFITQLLEDDSGRIWFNEARSNALFVVEDSVVQTIGLNTAGDDGGATALTVSEGGVMFAHGSKGDIYRLQGTNVEHYARVGAKVATLLRDRDAWWAGTRDAGIIRLNPCLFYPFATGDPRLDKVYSTAAAPDGQVWLGTEGGVLRVEGGHLKRVPFAESRPTVMPVHSIFVDREKRIWAARGGLGVWKFDGERFRHEFKTAQVPGNWRVWALAQDPDGFLWFGSDDGVYRQAGEGLQRVGEKAGLLERDVRAIAFGPDGAVWIGTYSHGVYRMAGNEFTTFNAGNGLANNEVHVLRFDAKGRLWVGTQNGLSLWAGNRWFTFTTAHGLFDNVFNDIQEDGVGRMWFSCNRGVYWMEQQELLDVAAGRRERAGHVAYGERDGMPTSETNGEHQPSAAVDPAGRFWFPTSRGVARIDPAHVTKKSMMPAVFIEAVVADGEAWPLGRWGRPLNLLNATRVHEPARGEANEIRVRPGQNGYIEFSYTTPIFDAPETVRFEYRLEGHDRDWIQAGNRRSAYYTNLRPGRYQFRVRARNSRGLGDESSAVVGLRVPPQFFQTWWFRVLLVGTSATLLTAFVVSRLRVRQRMLALEHAAALEQQRSRIAQDMHDELGASLTKIAILSEVAKRELPATQRASAQFNAISETARDVVDGLAEIVWTVNPANDTLDSLCAYMREHAGEFFERTGIDCEFDIPLELPEAKVTAEFRRNVFYAAKEIMTNAARHSTANRVTLRIRLEENGGRHIFRLQISDNGRGFDAGAVPRFSNGLESVRKRIADLAGTVEWQSERTQGTAVIITVPLVLEPDTQTV